MFSITCARYLRLIWEEIRCKRELSVCMNGLKFEGLILITQYLDERSFLHYCLEYLKDKDNIANDPHFTELLDLLNAIDRCPTFVSCLFQRFSKGSLDSDVQQQLNSLFLVAANQGYIVTVEILSTAGAVVGSVDSQMRRPLHLAASNGHEAVVRLLVETLGADKETKNNDHSTALHVAAQNGHEAVVRLLVETLGADKEAKNNDHSTALHVAAQNGHEAVVRLLVETLGADKEAKNNDHSTALHVAAQNGHEAVVRLLVETLGADKEAKEMDGSTAMHAAAQNGHQATVWLLLDRGSEIQAEDCDRWTPLHMAAHSGHEGTVRMLLDRGAEIQAEAGHSYGSTALHEAARGGHEATVRLLLDRGAAIQAKDDHGRTALHVAAQNRQEATVRLLLDRGADIKARDCDSWMTLHLATQNRHEATVRLFGGRYATRNQLAISHCLKTLRFNNSRYEKISAHYEHTIECLWESPEYCAWNSSVNSSLLFIEGKPGSGKSTLVRYFIDNLRADGAIVAKFFYSHRGGELARDHRKMLQSLLYDILDADKSFFIHFEQAYRNLEDAEFGWQTARTWPYETLKKILRACLTHPLKRRLFLIIDAMDESDGADRADIIQFLQDLSISTDKKCVVKVFLASRPINEFHLHHASRSHRILLQEKNRKDIEYYTHEFLQQPEFHTVRGITDHIKDFILKNAHGVFLWVSLVRDELIRFIRRGEAQDRILNLLKSLPRKLESYYEHMLQGLNGDDDDDTRDGIRILQFCFFSHRAVQLLELDHALAIPGQLQDRPPNSFWEDKRPADVRYRLLHCAGNFVEIRDTPVSRLDSKSFILLLMFVRPELIIHSSHGGICHCSSHASNSA